MKNPEYFFSFYSNSTRVNISKVGFPAYIKTYVDKALDDAVKYQKGKIPFLIYPIFANALMKYDKKWKRDRIFIWCDHVCIGEVIEDIPRAEPICADCGSKVKKVPESLVELHWFKRLLKKYLFKQAWDYPETYFYRCTVCKCEKTTTKVI